MPAPALAMIPALAKTGLGIIQTGAGLLTKRPKRPEYSVPTAVTQAAQATRQQANLTQRPGASAAQAVIGTNTANTVDTIQNVGGSASNVMQGLMNAQSQQNRAMLGEQSKNEAFRYQSFQDNIRSLQTLGRYQDKAWDWNQGQKYIEKRDRRDALINAGINNMVGGADDFVSMKALTDNNTNKTPSKSTQNPFNRKINFDRAALQERINGSIQNSLRNLGVNQRNLAIF